MEDVRDSSFATRTNSASSLGWPPAAKASSPERLGKALGEVDRTPTDDYWAVAVLIFSMLLEGQHPTDGVGYPPERARRLRLGLFPMLGEGGFALPKYALPISVLPPTIRVLFERCFRAGYADPAQRPTAVEWKRALHETAATLVQCGSKRLHWYSPHLTECPWCNELQVTGIDRFVIPASAQVVKTEQPEPLVRTVAGLLGALFN